MIRRQPFCPVCKAPGLTWEDIGRHMDRTHTRRASVAAAVQAIDLELAGLTAGPRPYVCLRCSGETRTYTEHQMKAHVEHAHGLLPHRRVDYARLAETGAAE